jgi:prepilin peptidase CpaA
MPHYSPVQILVVVVVLMAAITDIRSRRIPNWLTLFGVLAGLVLNFVLAGWAGLAHSAEGLLLGFGCYFALYALRAMGAGDVKLMAAVGAIVGPVDWFKIFIASAFAGAVLAIFLMIQKHRVRETLRNTFFIFGELMHFRAPYERRKHLDVRDPNALNMPHGVAIATGTLACLLLGVI